MPSTAILRRRILISLLIGLLVMVGLGLFSDIRSVGAEFRSFNWLELPAILGLTLLNYLLRWMKWDYYLRRLGQGQGINRADSGLLFTAGLVMSVTPGKVGEVLKSYLLKRLNGTPISASAPIVLAERLTDGLAMLLLMGLGLTLYPPARPAFVVLLLLSLLGIVLVQFRPLMERVLTWITELPFGNRLAAPLMTAYVSSQKLLNWRILLASTVLSVISWFCECLALYFVLLGLGVPGDLRLLLVATFVFAASTLLGLVSFLPGGLGVSEASSAALLVTLVPTTIGPATTATIIIRFSTLWFGVALGMIALLIFGRRHGLDATSEALPGASEQLS